MAQIGEGDYGAQGGASTSIVPGTTPSTGVANKILRNDNAGHIADGSFTDTGGSVLACVSNGDLSFGDGLGTGDTVLGVGGSKQVLVRDNSGNRMYISAGGAVASAGTITPTGSLFHVTGTTNITDMSITWAGGWGILAGQIVTIIFDGILTFTDGNHLKLAGNLVTTADDTITLRFDGSNWYEISRSVN